MPIRVLILDDEQKYLDQHSRWLKGAGIDVKTTRFATEAVEMVKFKPSIKVVLIDEILKDDVGRPQHWQGSDARKEILKHRPHVKFIVITSKSEREIEDEITSKPEVSAFYCKSSLENPQYLESKYKKLIQEIKTLLQDKNYSIYWNIINRTMWKLLPLGISLTQPVTEINKVEEYMVAMIKKIMCQYNENCTQEEASGFYKILIEEKMFFYPWISPILKSLGLLSCGLWVFLQFSHIGGYIGGIIVTLIGLAVGGSVAALLYAFQAAEFGVKTMSYCCSADSVSSNMIIPTTENLVLQGNTVKTMIDCKAIAFLGQEPYLPILATAHVLSTLLGASKVPLNCENITQLQSIPRESVVLLMEEELRWLVDMRRNGSAGAVLVFSALSYDELITKYPIFKIGGSKESHQSCNLSWNLVNILSMLDNLQPLDQGTQETVITMIRENDKAIDEKLDLVLLKKVKGLWQGDFSQNLNNLETDIKELWQGHKHDFSRKSLIDIGEYGKATIEDHCWNLIAKIRGDSENQQQSIQLLEKVLTDWGNIIKKFGEDL